MGCRYRSTLASITMSTMLVYHSHTLCLLPHYSTASTPTLTSVPFASSATQVQANLHHCQLCINTRSPRASGTIHHAAARSANRNAVAIAQQQLQQQQL
jgi:hypothetical protein